MAQQKVNVTEHEKNFADVLNQIRDLKSASRHLRQLEASKKNSVLLSLADQLIAQEKAILDSNRVDLQSLPQNTPPAFRDRLTLNRQRLEAMAESLRQVATLPDPVGEIIEEKKLKNGLFLKRVRAPLGVIFMIFESRPNVILEAFSLAFKTGNAIILRGGSESKNTAASLYSIMHKLLESMNLGHSCFLGINRYERSLVEILLQRKDLIDITVPRGGEKLIEFVEQTAVMPIIKNDRGLCHTYVDKEANLEMAVNVVTNAKTQRPGVCNSLETVLVHEDVALKFLPLLHSATDRFDLRWKCDSRSLDILRDFSRIEPASQQDWDTEHLDQIINCGIVKDLDQALNHIEIHGSKHSEAIITENQAIARRFQSEVDAAVVYWNASTRFTDGFEFGLGGELGISTQKLHVRGPVGLKELTTPRWIIDGDGQIRL